MNLLLTIIKYLLLVFITIAALQIGAVYLLRFLQPELTPADLVTIMSGSKDRITYGCRVAADTGVTHLMLINNSPKGSVFVECLWRDDKRKWEPLDINTEVRLPSLMSDIRENIVEMEEMDSDSD